jgi:hypothetical protein
VSALKIEVSISGVEGFDRDLQAFRNAIADRKPLHARMAVDAVKFTRDYLLADTDHKTANRLGAAPTGFRAKNAAAVQPDSDDTQAMVRIPRRTGLGRAFGDVVLSPGSGRTYLTIPAHAQTYGKSARDFPEDTFRFAFLGRFRALVFADGPYKGEVGYWLKRTVTQKQDRTLLPTDQGYQEVGRRSALSYITSHIYRQS